MGKLIERMMRKQGVTPERSNTGLGSRLLEVLKETKAQGNQAKVSSVKSAKTKIKYLENERLNAAKTPHSIR